MHAYPRGESPFKQPKAGDIIRSTRTGVTRTVVSCGRDEIDYVVLGKPRTSKKASWACWCTREKAELVYRRQRN